MKKTALAGLIILVLLSPLLFLLLAYQSTAFQEKYYPSPERKEVLDFLRGNKEENKETKTKEMKINFTALEVSHLQDVQKVMRFMDYLFYSISAFAILLIIFLYRKELLSKALLYSGLFSLALFALIFLFYFFGFSFLFTAFHLLFFPQGNWQFPADSLLIQIFPGDLFIKLSGIIFGKAAALAGAAMLFSFYLKKKKI